MKLLMLVVLPGLLLAQSPGSLYSPAGRLADFTRDLRANEVGDIVTIVVNDTASALANGATNTSRKSSINAGVTSVAGFSDPHLANLLNTSNNQQLQGQGATSRNMTITTTISARVIQVTPNGSLLVEGMKDVGVNSE